MDYPDDTKTEDIYTDEEEYADNVIDEQRDQWEEGIGNYPTSKKPESLFTLFKDVWRTKDSSKVANLDNVELGDLGLSVRECKRIGLFAGIVKHQKFGDYFTQLGEITLSTSMAKKGWFVEQFVTTRKFAHKGTISNLGNASKSKSKWRIFGKGKEQEQEA